VKWILAVLGVAMLTAAQERPTFEVASVKEIAPGEKRYVEGEKLTPSTFLDRTSLLSLIVRAYLGADGAGICANSVAFGETCPLITRSMPSWVRTERYEVQAKLPAGAAAVQPSAGPSSPGTTSSPRRSLDPLQFRLMLQALLEDRFGLRVHRETRDLQVWALTLGKKPLRLKRSGAPEIRKRADGTPVAIHGLGVLLRSGNPDGTSKGQMTFQASTMQDAADSLTRYLDRPVVDRTRLDGEYDFTIEYEVDPGVRPKGGLPFLNAGLTGARLAPALEDLGLKLESANALFEVLVVDDVRKPTPN